MSDSDSSSSDCDSDCDINHEYVRDDCADCVCTDVNCVRCFDDFEVGEYDCACREDHCADCGTRRGRWEALCESINRHDESSDESGDDSDDESLTSFQRDILYLQLVIDHADDWGFAHDSSNHRRIDNLVKMCKFVINRQSSPILPPYCFHKPESPPPPFDHDGISDWLNPPPPFYL